MEGKTSEWQKMQGCSIHWRLGWLGKYCKIKGIKEEVILSVSYASNMYIYDVEL